MTVSQDRPRYGHYGPFVRMSHAAGISADGRWRLDRGAAFRAENLLTTSIPQGAAPVGPTAKHGYTLADLLVLAGNARWNR